MINYDKIRATVRVAKIELNSMFYSPVAWLVLTIFAIQTGMAFAGIYTSQLRFQETGYDLWKITSFIYNEWNGVLPNVLRYIYLYIPLITMGLMSREYQSGSIRLLYSSPITDTSIILGKFLVMMVYGMALVGVLGVFVIFSAITIEGFDYPMILAAMLGLYLLILAYSAIGLFMSSITQYQVVAAVGTLVILAGLNYVGNVGQDYDAIRNLTYWLSIAGRSESFVKGLVASNDVFYFLIVIGAFLSLSILRLNTEKNIMSLWAKSLRYGSIVLVTLLLGWVSSTPYTKYFYDATHTKSNTLSQESQEIVKKLEGPLTITTYANLLDENFQMCLPRDRNWDYRYFEKYHQFKPEMEIKYVYYYDKVDNPGLEQRYPGKTDEERVAQLCKAYRISQKMFLTPEEIHKVIDLAPEKNRFVRVIEREDGRTSVLRTYNDNDKTPSEAAMSAAMKRLTDPVPLVSFVSGYGARDITNYGGRGFYLFAEDKWSRNSLPNYGFDVCSVDLDREEINSDSHILVISDLQQPLSVTAMAKVQAYIEKGGNLFILGDYGREANMNQVTVPLGVRFVPGIVANENQGMSPSIAIGFFSPEAGAKYPAYRKLQQYGYITALPTAQALDYSGVSGFEVTPVVVSTVDSWIETETTDFVDGEFRCNPEAGERKGPQVMVLTLNREVNGREQRIVIAGDADFISNETLTSRYAASNYSVISGSFRWLSGDVFPVDVSLPDYKDNKFRFVAGYRDWVSRGCVGMFPLLIALMGAWVIIRRQRK